MRYLALACDYDGTLASAGKVSNETCLPELPDLLSAFPRCALFDAMVESAARRFCRVGALAARKSPSLSIR
jgi:hypothetical protein